ncbi:MFS transporter [Sphingomonas echinoides]|uniref:MFS transporter n=1 Tax=Sphingomonas echinoides TaxID=59803 RepID=A0ABU4PNI3_9SPHN|nr:MFS transporter [Sphingomonas echinoides]MDX5983520.1 MFS transporter [Sphingomonas echinoides]
MGLNEKPVQRFGGLWNISFGFFGIQIGFALQNANMSRIFQTLGGSLDDLSYLWIAAPLTGLLVQPIIGHYSDRTWTRFGRRRPYFFAGAVLAALALFVMPDARILWFAALTLWVLDASINVSMEPFRAFVGDMLRKDQHTAGYALQTAFIGAGAVVGSLFPFVLTHLGVSGDALGGIPATVRYSFWFGGAALLLAVLWTVGTTREYSPAEMKAFGEPMLGGPATQPVHALAARGLGASLCWIAAGAGVVVTVPTLGLQKEVYLLGALLIAYGLASIAAILLARGGKADNPLSLIIGDFSGMPTVMKRLALVQFFSWSALFIMWIYTTPVVAQYAFGSSDPTSAAYNAGGDWVGVLFAVYNGVATIVALLVLPRLAARIGKVRTHGIGLLCGALGYASFLVLRDPNLLVLSEIGVGIAWASILAMPYAILASSLPQAKLGIYMGLFNVFIVVPQLLVATVMGSVLKAFFPTEPIWTMAFAAAVMALAALAMLRVPETGNA